MEQYFSYQNKTIYYQVAGVGKPVVLLHGFGEESSIFNRQKEFLKNSCQLIIPDLPGTNNSELLEDMSIEAMADCIHALLEELKVNHVILLGHSMGGYITLAFAEKYSSMLSAFGLIHSTAFADSAEKKQNRLKGIEIMNKYGAFHFLKTVIPNLFAKTFKETAAQRVEDFINAAQQFSTESCCAYYYAMMQRPDRKNVLKSTNLPVLFVLGTEDVAAPLSDVLQQVYLPDVSYVHVFENVGHMSMMEAATELNQYLDAFICSV